MSDFSLGIHAWLYILTSCYAMLFLCHAMLRCYSRIADTFDVEVGMAAGREEGALIHHPPRAAVPPAFLPACLAEYLAESGHDFWLYFTARPPPCHQ